MSQKAAQISPKEIKLMLAGLGIVALVAGGAALGKGWPALQLTLFELPRWQEVSATVVATSLEVVEGDFVRNPQGKRLRRGEDGYRPVVEYKYSVGGAEYTSKRFCLVDSISNDRAAQQARLDRYTVGKTVSAYVNPDDPTDAVLDREDLTGPAAVAGIGVLFALVGVVLLVILGVKMGKDKTA